MSTALGLGCCSPGERLPSGGAARRRVGNLGYLGQAVPRAPPWCGRDTSRGYEGFKAVCTKSLSLGLVLG